MARSQIKTIAIDISPIQYEGTGVGRYTRELTLHMLKCDSRNKYILFYNSFGNPFSSLRDASRFSGFTNVVIKEFRIPEKVLHFIWNTLHIMPIEYLIGKHDVFFYSDWFTPPSGAHKVTTIHDMIYKKYPETVDPYIRSTQAARIRFFEKNEASIFVNSETTKADIVKNSNISSSRIHVLHFGVTVEKQSDEKIANTKRTYNLSQPYILTVGKQEPRKNIPRLIEAFEKLDRPDLDLVIIGPSGWGKQLTTKNNVRFIGFVDDSQLCALYQGALFFVSPSLYEGFIFPLLEAMALGCPTCAGQGSAFSELADGATYFFDQLSVDSIHAALFKLANDSSLREKLIKKGAYRAAEFYWDKTAHEALTVIDTLI
jgi:glycosyltransferase involved in cell wall biosynthesis